jgi:hypothetical protein
MLPHRLILLSIKRSRILVSCGVIIVISVKLYVKKRLRGGLCLYRILEHLMISSPLEEGFLNHIGSVRSVTTRTAVEPRKSTTTSGITRIEIDTVELCIRGF